MTSSIDTTKRAAFVAGLRAFADLLDTDHAIPSPQDADLWAFITEYGTGLTQDQHYTVVHDFADAHGVPVTEDHKGDRSAQKQFGPIHLRVHARADKKPEDRIVTRPTTETRSDRSEPEVADLIPA